MSIRYTSFDIEALKRIATIEAGANQCLEMVKIPEGSFNKIFLLSFDNGVKLIAKIPCPLVASRRLCTASEVATMDFARNILDLPVPRVLKYSADSDASKVGCEYILMEHVQGVELRKRIDDHGGEGTRVADQLIGIECKFAQCRFSQIGSLYYKEDVSLELRERPLYAEGFDGGGSDRFRIGPYVDWDIWREKRSDLDTDRGPWPDALSYIKAIVYTEQKWLSTCAIPDEPRHPFCRPGSENDPNAHIRLLDKFLAVIPHILPPHELCTPVLWHNDLHASNIVIPEEGTADILGLLDWQGISIRPLFLQASFASCMRYRGDDRITILPGKVIPKFPPEFDTYSEEEKAYLNEERRRAILHKYYETLVASRNPVAVAVRSYPHLKYIVPPILITSRTWYEGTHHMRQLLSALQEDWESIVPNTPCPITFDADEVSEHLKVYPKLVDYEERVEKITQGLLLEGDGWVTNERYGEVMRLSKYIKRKWNKKA